MKEFKDDSEDEKYERGLFNKMVEYGKKHIDQFLGPSEQELKEILSGATLQQLGRLGKRSSHGGIRSMAIDELVKRARENEKKEDLT